MSTWPAPARYALAVAVAHAVFRGLAELGYLRTDERGRVMGGPKLS